MQDEIVKLRLVKIDLEKKLDIQMQESDYLKQEKQDLEKLFKKAMRQVLSIDSDIGQLSTEVQDTRKERDIVIDQYKVFKKQADE